MTFWRLIAVLALVAVNAFFVAAEFGLVAVRPSRLAELGAQGSARARTALAAVRNLNLMLSGCQLGITFASLGLGWVGEPVIAGLVEGLFRRLPAPLDAIATHGVAAAIAFAIITFLHVVLGELVPKNLAIAVPETIALWVAAPMRLFTIAFRPFIWLFNEGANRFVGIFGIAPQTEVSRAHSPEEIAIILEDSRRGGTIDAPQSDLLSRALRFSDKQAHDVMIRRSEVHAVSRAATLQDALDAAATAGHTRYPVHGEHVDDLVGTVHLADFARAAAHKRSVTAGDVMRDALYVPDSLLVGTLLTRMSERESHLAIVVDEYGSTVGIVTIGDILAELIGEIGDEHRHAEDLIQPLEHGGFRAVGTVLIEEFARATGVPLPTGDYETLGGLLGARLGRFPQRGDRVELDDDWTLTVVAMEGRRVAWVDARRRAR